MKTMRTGSMVAITHKVELWKERLEREKTMSRLVVRSLSESFNSTSITTMAKLVSTLCVWQSKLLQVLHLCNQEIDDMKVIYKKVFLSIRYALYCQWHCTTVACQRPATSTSTLIKSHH